MTESPDDLRRAAPTPWDLLARTDLSRGEAAAILRQWAFNAREWMVAGEENALTSGPPAFGLEEICAALPALDEAAAPRPVPTTHG